MSMSKRQKDQNAWSKEEETKICEDELLAQETVGEEPSNVARFKQESSSDYEDDEDYARRLQEEERVQMGQDASSEALAKKLNEEELARQFEYESKIGSIFKDIKATNDESCARQLQQQSIEEKMRVDEDAQVGEDESFARRLLQEELDIFYRSVAKGDEKKAGKAAGVRVNAPGAVSVESPTSATQTAQAYQPPSVVEARVGGDDQQIQSSRLEENNLTISERDVAVDVASTEDVASSRTSSAHPQEESPPLLEAWVAPQPVLAQATTFSNSPDQPPPRLGRRMKLLVSFLVLAVSALATVLGVLIIGKGNSNITPSRVINNTLTTIIWQTEEVTVVLKLDDKPEEVGWTMDCETGPENVLQFDPGFYDGRYNELVIQTEKVVYGGECNFKIVDTGGDGIKDGYFKIYQGHDITDEDSFLVEGSGWTDSTSVTFRLKSSAPSLSPSALTPDMPSSCPSEDQYHPLKGEEKHPEKQHPKPSTSTPSGIPSQDPSESPSEQPSSTPSVMPSETPSEEPSLAPSEMPSDAPSADPTEKPTNPPTKEPTPDPTPEPTRKPTSDPTHEPTQHPTNPPTSLPTPLPTRPPSPRPTPCTPCYWSDWGDYDDCSRVCDGTQVRWRSCVCPDNSCGNDCGWEDTQTRSCNRSGDEMTLKTDESTGERYGGLWMSEGGLRDDQYTCWRQCGKQLVSRDSYKCLDSSGTVATCDGGPDQEWEIGYQIYNPGGDCCLEHYASNSWSTTGNVQCDPCTSSDYQQWNTWSCSVPVSRPTPSHPPPTKPPKTPYTGPPKQAPTKPPIPTKPPHSPITKPPHRVETKPPHRHITKPPHRHVDPVKDNNPPPDKNDPPPPKDDPKVVGPKLFN